MDPLSIAAGCAGLISTIGTLSLSIYGFVRTCREARKDLDKVSRELQSLQSVLGLIEDDATNEEKPFPPVIGQHVLSIISNCNSVILEIEACIAQYGQKQLKARVTWAIGGQGDVEKLRTNLEAHKSSLELALDMHSLTIVKDIKADTTEIRNDTTSIKENTEQILQEIVRLQAQLPKDVTTPNDYVLQRFLEEMTTYTEIALDTTIVGSDDDSIRAFYDIEEVSEVSEASEASVEQKEFDDSLATTNEPKHQRSSIADGTSEPGGNLTTPDQPPNQQSATPRKILKPVSRLGNKSAHLLATHAESLASQSPSKDEPTSAQERHWTRPIELPIPKSFDGDLGTSNEPQSLSLPIRDGVPPGASAVRVSSDEGLVASKESQPQDLAESVLPEFEIRRRDIIRRAVEAHRQVIRPESSASPGPSQDEAPAPDFNPSSTEFSASECAVVGTDDKKSKKRTIVLNEVIVDESGYGHVKLLNGNLVFDCHYLNRLANKGHLPSEMRRIRGNEWGTWRYMAVTCPPRQFTTENYPLRLMTSSRPRIIRTIFHFRLRPSESPAEFARRWRMIFEELHRLSSPQRSSVIVHIHGPPGWRGLDKNISAALQEMCLSRAPEPIRSVDGTDLLHCYNEEDLDAYTNMYPQKAKFRLSKLHMRADSLPVRVISTAPMISDEPSEDWVTAIGRQLRPDVIIDMTDVSEVHRYDGTWSRGAEADGGAVLAYLSYTKDAWGIPLKFVPFE
ncbi:hypothetical protein CEP51_013854 [Fusarium floridanum]|uniref:chitin synthase n=1 Tax=Fusarium floridanum TaxID=1325733 RepID=A0A428Q3U1_9HYPO|nr:hypothetical protein CEP51_013854 [Fusarium floridanum]